MNQVVSTALEGFIVFSSRRHGMSTASLAIRTAVIFLVFFRIARVNSLGGKKCSFAMNLIIGKHYRSNKALSRL